MKGEYVLIRMKKLLNSERVILLRFPKDCHVFGTSKSLFENTIILNEQTVLPEDNITCVRRYTGRGLYWPKYLLSPVKDEEKSHFQGIEQEEKNKNWNTLRLFCLE